MQLRFQANPGKPWAAARNMALALPEVLARYPFARQRRYRQQGFTLVELLVVITLLGILALGVVLSLDGVDEDSRIKLTKFEMSELHRALLQFKRDVGHLPDAADNNYGADRKLDLLFSCQNLSGAQPDYDIGCAEFNIDSARGWNGPYVLAEKNGNDRGLFDAWGTRYRLYDEDQAAAGSGFARIVSFGSDRQDGVTGMSNAAAEDCSPIANSDDIVLCLVR